MGNVFRAVNPYKLRWLGVRKQSRLAVFMVHVACCALEKRSSSAAGLSAASYWQPRLRQEGEELAECKRKKKTK